MPALGHLLRTFGIDIRRFQSACRNLVRYRAERDDFKAKLGGDFAWGDELPILDERDADSGQLGAYFHQDLLIARWILEANPARHVDVGSRLDGFVGHLSLVREVEVLDIRPQPARVPGVTFHQLDLMAPLPTEWVAATDSLSCLHTIEHFGLGRYGDAIDPQGHLKGLARLKRMVKPGGKLYLSTPIGSQRIEFNAHRIFAAATLPGWFADGWEIERFAYIDDECCVHTGVDWNSPEAVRSFGCHAGVGIVVARKIV
ncbi:MAG: DUF268 domain-containing protein [Verrucomicrobiota bacterium]